jgi:hypothetical protein
MQLTALLLALAPSPQSPAQVTGPIQVWAAPASHLTAVSAPYVAPVPPALELDAASRDRLASVEAAITEGRGDEALAAARMALEWVPDSVELLAAAGRAARAADQLDLALWYTLRARRALSELDSDDWPAGLTLESLDGLWAELDPRFDEYTAALERFATVCFELGKSAVRRSLWANAVELFEACRGTSLEGDARKQLDKIYKKDDAIDALIASGLEIDFEDPAVKKSRNWIEREDSKHADWEKRYEIDTRGGYTIETNVGYEYAHEIARAMDQVNVFLRDMYQHKVQGQRMRGCRILIHKTRDDFFQNWQQLGIGPGVGGFFSPNDNMIVSYDYRSTGETTQDTMETLCHELSHQFLRDVTKNLVPAWINEGIACYFEGTVLLDNGKVIANLVPDGRLRSLRSMISNDYFDVRDIITYFQPGSYQGAYYPYGWGLIYFMRNYENSRGERIYRPFFDEYVETFKGGGKRSLLEEFVENFVGGPGVDGVSEFDQFYLHWKKWILDLYETHFGGEEVVAELRRKAEVQKDNGFAENALETFGRVLRKDRKDPFSLWHLAEINRELDREDVAMYYYRRVVEWANSQIDDTADEAGTRAEFRVPGLEKTAVELREEAYARMGEINEDITVGIRAANTALHDDLLAMARGYVDEDELPYMGLMALDRTQELVGPSAPQLALGDLIRESGKVDLRKVRRLWIDDELTRWLRDSSEYSADGLELVGEALTLAYATYAEMPPEEYRLEVTISVDREAGEPHAVAGLFLGASAGEDAGNQENGGQGERKLIAWDASVDHLVRITDGPRGPAFEERIAPLDLGDGKPHVIALDISEREVVTYIDDEKVGQKQYRKGELNGIVGLVVQGCRARFSELRMIR